MIYEVALLGLGPCGYSASNKLDEANVNYISVDLGIGIKECGGLLTPRTVSYLERNGLEKLYQVSLKYPYRADLVVVKCDMRGQCDLVEKRRRYLVNVDRNFPNYKFNKMLLQDIGNNIKGVVKSIISENGIFKIVLSDGRIIFSRHVIDCRGANAGYVKKREIAIQQYYVNSIGLEEVVFIVTEGLTFYTWIIPKGDKLVIGYLRKHENVLNEEKIIVQALEILGYTNGKLGKRIARKGHMITLVDRFEDLVLEKNGVLIAGEAAGLVTRNWGEGIYSALLSGEIAARNYFDIDRYKREIEISLRSFLEEKIEKARKLYRK